MTNTVTTLYLISDFNVETLGRCLENDIELLPRVSVRMAPFGQVVPALLNPSPGEQKEDYCFVWTSIEAVAPTFGKALAFEYVDEAKLVLEVEQFSASVIKCRSRFRAVFVSAWVLPVFNRGLGLGDLQTRSGLRRLLLEANLLLARALEGVSGVYLLDSYRWISAAGKTAWSPKLWYLSKTPYGPEVFAAAMRDVKAALSAVTTPAKKVIVVDLDDTLWGGAIGDVGWEGIVLGGHNHQGEAFVDFQRALKSLKNRGVILAIASKNEENVALRGIRNHPEMALRLEDFAAWRINWNDKAANLVELASELNLGLNSMVFIDDNCLERSRVQQALPEVLVPKWPDDKTAYVRALLELDCFDTLEITEEDAGRTQMYAAARQRQSAVEQYESIERWLHSLETKLRVEDLSDQNRGRVVQLLNKANQMNLSTRRLTENELVLWSKQSNRKFWAFRVKDKFGDSGLAGILSLQTSANSAQIVDFILSCRVMGRGVEAAMVAVAVGYCKTLGIQKLTARYVETEKNMPCYEFWLHSGFTHDKAENIFSWATNASYPVPLHLELSASHQVSNVGVEFCARPADELAENPTGLSR